MRSNRLLILSCSGPVVEPGVLARGLDADDVVRLLDHAEQAPVPLRIAAERAQLAVADVVTDAAEPQLVFDVEQGPGQIFGLIPARAQDMESEALGRFLSDAGQVLELGDEARQRLCEIRHSPPAWRPARVLSLTAAPERSP
jgi:hypothetical protein